MALKRVGINQSNYIPWKGFFDFIHSVDELILLDDVQYTRRDWRNRNRIKTPNGVQWLSIPVQVKGKYHQLIKETQISDPAWADEHWKTLQHAYQKAPFFSQYAPMLAELYGRAGEETYLSRVNHLFLTAISALMGCTTPITWSEDYQVIEGKSERLLHLCQQAGAQIYISGPSAQNYLDEDLFAAHGIQVQYMDYGGYPEYPQLYPPFEHAVTVLDLLFNTGDAFGRYTKTFQPESAQGA